MQFGGKGKLAKPRDFQRNSFVIFGEPLAKGCFGGGVGVGDRAWNWVGVWVFLLIFVVGVVVAFVVVVWRRRCGVCGGHVGVGAFEVCNSLRFFICSVVVAVFCTPAV